MEYTLRLLCGNFDCQVIGVTIVLGHDVRPSHPLLCPWCRAPLRPAG